MPGNLQAALGVHRLVRPPVFIATMVVALASTLVAAPGAHAAVTLQDYGAVDDEAAVAGYRGAGLEVVIPQGAHWGLGTFQPVPTRTDEAWFRYMLILDDWSPTQSGKLPGFASLRSSSARGCVPATPSSPGWSARMMYRPVGAAGAPEGSSRLGFYVYHLDQPSDCGEIMEWGDRAVVAPGGWHCIEGHVRLNDVGERNGELAGWVDGAAAFHRGGLRFRETSGVGVDDLWLNVFSGGKPTSPERLALRLDEVAVSTTSRIGCPDSFDDDEVDPNEPAINRLAELGLFTACGPYRACPSDPVTGAELTAMLDQAAEAPPSGAGVPAAGPVTRGEAAVIISQAFALPPGRHRRYADITDPAQELAAAALAGARIAGGCAAGRFCPDDPLTRGQAAAMIAGAMTQQRIEPPTSGPTRRPTLDDALARARGPLTDRV